MSLAELVVEYPALTGLLERLRLDFCCRGRRSLAAACAEQDLDVDTLVRVIEAQAFSDPVPGHNFDGRAVPLGELCQHIVSAHHEPLRRDLPQLAETLTKVVRAHGNDDPRLSSLAHLFDGLARELQTHLDREERLLFPACTALESGDSVPDGHSLLDELAHSHLETGETLAQLRELAGDYRLETARCSTHRALLDGLQALEHDLHLHIHEENNVLFPRIRSRLWPPEGRRPR